VGEDMIQRNHIDEFNEAYEKYKKEVEAFSGGLIHTDKAEFTKMYAFYSSAIYPVMYKYFEELCKVYSKGIKLTKGNER
jgi:hypothetical protein